MEGSVKRVISAYGGDAHCRITKRGLDIGLSALALGVLWPFLLMLCAAIVLDSPGAGPVFVQTRVGKDGVPFRMYKFRTMVPDAESRRPALEACNEMDGPVFKLKNDPRITRLGKLLRRSGIDELPQLFNVLKGEMSLVGPRPGLPEEAEKYDAIAARRLSVLPGITCYWQIQPDRNSLSFREWMELDLRYIREQSLLTDVKILLATIKALRRMDGQ